MCKGLEKQDVIKISDKLCNTVVLLSQSSDQWERAVLELQVSSGSDSRIEAHYQLGENSLSIARKIAVWFYLSYNLLLKNILK